MTDEYFLNRQVIISSYDENWPGMFEKEKMLILSVIEKYDVIVEHIGNIHAAEEGKSFRIMIFDLR